MTHKETLQTAVRQLLRDWSNTAAELPADVSALRTFRQLDAQSDGHQPAAVARQLIETALAALAHQDSAAADLLTQRFVRGESARTVARQLAVSESQFYLLQNQALAALAHFHRRVGRPRQNLAGRLAGAATHRQPPLFRHRLG